MNWSRTLTVARTDLKQLMQARDFWGPMVILGALFFVILPTILLTMITQIGSVEMLSEISETLDVLPVETQEQLQGTSPEGRTGYALAVFLFAPVAFVVPLTISTAVGVLARNSLVSWCRWMVRYMTGLRGVVSKRC